MVDNEPRPRRDADREADHHDGKIEVGNHSGRLSELTGVPTPEYFPTSFFELQDGQVTLEQIRVLHFFVQECRNKEAVVRNKPFILKRYIERYEADKTDLQAALSIKEKATENRQSIDDLDYILGEAQELLAVLNRVNDQIDSGRGPIVSPEDRQAAISEATQELDSLQAEYDEIKSLQSDQRTEAQKKRYSYSSFRFDELQSIIKAYSVPSQLAAEQLRSIRTSELKSLLAKRDTFADESAVTDQVPANLDAQIQELQQTVDMLNEALTDYEGFVAREMAKPILSVEAQRLQTLLRDLKIVLAEYKGPLIEGVSVQVPDRVALVSVLKSQTVKELIPESSAGLE